MPSSIFGPWTLVFYRITERSPFVLYTPDPDKESEPQLREAAYNLSEWCYEVRVMKCNMMQRWGPVDTGEMPVESL